ncbi:hypothetical protein NUW54_g4407 [Trametes sanguinea]|uniref:Uncharacterized protein n=1 Tax=Trametes sanguinea TaxID=158606 RepID=A0ACC1PZW6_9APHY|nr:hypothetical protein NUW54_g4407 [Trametes sanguinea]
MADFNARQLLEKAIAELRQSGLLSIEYKELLNKVVRDNKDEDFRGGVALFLEKEILAGRLIVTETAEERVISLDVSGVASYMGQNTSASSGVNTSTRSRVSKSQAQMDYIRSARILGQVLQALHGHEPEMLLRDVKKLPNLVRSNLETVTYLEEINQNVSDEIEQSNDRLRHLEERIKEAYGFSAKHNDIRIDLSELVIVGLKHAVLLVSTAVSANVHAYYEDSLMVRAQLCSSTCPAIPLRTFRRSTSRYAMYTDLADTPYREHPRQPVLGRRVHTIREEGARTGLLSSPRALSLQLSSSHIATSSSADTCRCHMHKYKRRSSYWRRLGGSGTAPGPSGRTHTLPRLGLTYRHKVKLEKCKLERELALCKSVMATSSSTQGDAMSSQVEVYRSLWYMSHSRAEELEELLVKHVDEKILRPILPYHQKFRSLDQKPMCG